MKKHRLLHIFAVISIVILSFSCSEMDEAERLIEAPLSSSDIVRNVLVEDFTGQKCVNCPTAHEIVEQLQQQYGHEHIVAVSIHGGNLAIHENDKPYGLANDLGEYYNSLWGVEEWPKGKINRSPLLAHTSWTSQILDDFVKFSPIEITVETNLSESTRKLQLSVKTSSSQAVEGNLQLWIVEDGIEARQLMPNGKTNNSYIHNNVLRDAINGNSGSSYSVAKNGTTNDIFEYTINENWVLENLAIVAFVYDDNGVVQVIRKSLYE